MDNKAKSTDTCRTYKQSVKISDPVSPTVDNPKPAAPGFVNPNPGGMLGPDWEKASDCGR
jgi:hypothetical protein